MSENCLNDNVRKLSKFQVHNDMYHHYGCHSVYYSRCSLFSKSCSKPSTPCSLPCRGPAACVPLNSVCSRLVSSCRPCASIYYPCRPCISKSYKRERLMNSAISLYPSVRDLTKKTKKTSKRPGKKGSKKRKKGGKVDTKKSKKIPIELNNRREEEEEEGYEKEKKENVKKKKQPGKEKAPKKQNKNIETGKTERDKSKPPKIEIKVVNSVLVATGDSPKEVPPNLGEKSETIKENGKIGKGDEVEKLNLNNGNSSSSPKLPSSMSNKTMCSCKRTKLVGNQLSCKNFGTPQFGAKVCPNCILKRSGYNQKRCSYNTNTCGSSANNVIANKDELKSVQPTYTCKNNLPLMFQKCSTCGKLNTTGSRQTQSQRSTPICGFRDLNRHVGPEYRPVRLRENKGIISDSPISSERHSVQQNEVCNKCSNITSGRIARLCSSHKSNCLSTRHETLLGKISGIRVVEFHIY